MDKAEALKIALLYAEAVKHAYDGCKVFLFGSYIKGNFNPDSNIDIAVVLNDYINFNEMQLELMRIRRRIDSRIEPHPFRKLDFTVSDPIVFEIQKYGREL